MTTPKVPVGPEDHIQGPQDAAATLLEYGNYECPFCGRAYGVIKAVQKHFGKRLRFVFRNFPLTQIHPNAEPAAETAEFAGAHERFWPMHDLFYENQDRLSTPLYVELAEDLSSLRRSWSKHWKLTNSCHAFGRTSPEEFVAV